MPTVRLNITEPTVAQKRIARNTNDLKRRIPPNNAKNDTPIADAATSQFVNLISGLGNSGRDVIHLCHAAQCTALSDTARFIDAFRDLPELYEQSLLVTFSQVIHQSLPKLFIRVRSEAFLA